MEPTAKRQKTCIQLPEWWERVEAYYRIVRDTIAVYKGRNGDVVSYLICPPQFGNDVEVPQWAFTVAHGNLMHTEFIQFAQQYFYMPSKSFNGDPEPNDTSLWWWDVDKIDIRMAGELNATSHPDLSEWVAKTIRQTCFQKTSMDLSNLVVTFLRDASLF